MRIDVGRLRGDPPSDPERALAIIGRRGRGPIRPPRQAIERVRPHRLERLGDETVGTVTMVARFGAAREVTLDALRVQLIFAADQAAEAPYRRAAQTAD